MSGKAQRKYVGEMMRFNKKTTQILRRISKVLPYSYNLETLLKLFQELYPQEWKELDQRYEQYKKKDEFLRRNGKKLRYKPISPREHFLSLTKVKHMLSKGTVSRHKANFNNVEYQEMFEKFKVKRLAAIQNKNEKINKANELIQNVEPLYIDVFIAAYHKRGISIEGKIEIFKELQKYNSIKVLDFFYKLNDSERNDQIRDMAFKHLQVTGNYAKLRKKFSGKRKKCMTETSQFYMTPFDLLEKIESNNVQNIKVYDAFISHSYKDSSLIKKVIKSLNKLSFNVYCDWTSDRDFLRRELVSDYTKVVLRKRIEQSHNIVLVKTENSLESDWVKFELDYSKELGKNIYCINLTDNTENEYIALKFDSERETVLWNDSKLEMV